MLAHQGLAIEMPGLFSGGPTSRGQTGLKFYGYIRAMSVDVPTTTKIAMLACSALEREVALPASNARHIVETRFIEMGLHEAQWHGLVKKPAVVSIKLLFN